MRSGITIFILERMDNIESFFEQHPNCSNLKSSDLVKEIASGKDADYLIEKYVLHNVPYYFKEKMDLYFELKKDISKHFGIPITNIYLVGSGQFGFSLVEGKLFRDFAETEDESQGMEASDLDFAIISTKAFDEIWDELYDFKISNYPRSEEGDKAFKEFKKYLFKGWIRPDKFPKNFKGKSEWFEFFASLNAKVNRQVTCGIFRNETCFIKKYKESLNDLIRFVKGV